MVFKRIFKKRSSSRRNHSKKSSGIIRSISGTKTGSCHHLDRYNEATPLDFHRPAKVETVTPIADDGDEYGYYYDNSESEMMSRNRTNSSDNCTKGDYWPGATVYMFPEEWKERTGSRGCCNNEMRRDHHRANNHNTNEEMIDGSMMIVEDEDRHDNNTSGGSGGGGYDITLAVDEELYKSNNNNNNNNTNNEQSSSVWFSCLSCV